MHNYTYGMKWLKANRWMEGNNIIPCTNPAM